MPAAQWDTYRMGARIPSVDSLIKHDASDQIEKLQRALSSVAYIEGAPFPGAPQTKTEDALFVGRLLLGMLCRGWPSFSSPTVEQALLESIEPSAGLTCQETGPAGQIAWRIDSADTPAPATWDDAIRGAMLRGDQRLGIDEAVVAMVTDSHSEQAFYCEHLVPLLGNAIGWLELQRPLASMVREDAPDPKHFGSERVDFALDLPGATRPVRLVIELDGPHHLKPPYSEWDTNRDNLLDKHGWQTRRVPVKTLDDGTLNYLPGALKAIIKGNPFPFTHIEDSDHALANPYNREATRLLLTPHAVARVQLALCRALMNGALHLSEVEWTIAVVEREVPCAELAVRDWMQGLNHLCKLYDIPIEVERVQVFVVEEHLAEFPHLVWKDRSEPHPRIVTQHLGKGNEICHVDLGIDVSVGAHPTRRYPTDPLSQSDLIVSHRVALRTAQRQSGYVVDAWPEPRPIANPGAHQASLDYFLQALFRKQEFRSGQMPIVERVLRREDVIGLLPTGAGKSITFQLPALLSPGLTLVIDPIKSLMQDQAENLKDAGVMDAIQINSDTSPAEREKVEWQFSQGEYRLVFISPERLQIQSFRDLLTTTAGKRPVAYLVVDEAHCVSEWGHDFRTAYLNLGRIATDYCGHDGVRPPTVALTGTASESVLRDIQRELEVEEDEAIVRPGQFARDELKFEIIPVSKGEKFGALTELIGTVIPERLGVEPGLLASEACGGIVFCPHVNGKLGVYNVATHLGKALPQFNVDFYSGEAPKKLEMSDPVWASYKADVQRGFKAGRIPLLVATSAFGMGIDKPNIRYTVHYAMAKSVEAFAQEAGRAGRDRHDAICAVLFTDHLAPGEGDPAAAPLDCLKPGIAVEKALAWAAEAGWDGDDAEMQMYLHGRSYQGILRESAAVRAFHHTWVEPHFAALGERTGQLVSVTVKEGEYRQHIEHLMVPLMPENPEGTEEFGEGTAGEDCGEKQQSRPDLQRIIYRLSLLGIVADYTVNYQPGNNVYELLVRAAADHMVVDELFNYVKRYRTSDRSETVKKRFETSPLVDPICRCIDTLCWFVYEEIEQRRRQGMYTMRKMLRESSNGIDFARRMNEMLSFTALTQTVFDVLRTDDFQEWSRIADEITAAESAEHVYYQCLRALEDAPRHPGLMLLVALALQGAEGDRRDDVVANFRDGLRQVRQTFSRNDQRKIADWVTQELARIAPTAAPAVLNRVIREELDPVLSGAVLRSINAGRLAADPILMRTSQRCVLRSIDNRLTRFMNA